MQGTVLAKRLDSIVLGRIDLHKPVIEYTYEVGGVQYRNDVFNIVDNDGTASWAREILGNYRVGAPCAVYYDSSHPRDSALSTAPNARAMGIMILGAFLGLAHLLRGLAATFVRLPTQC